jgi:putative transcriptional regulator
MTISAKGTDLLIAPPRIPDRRFRGTVLMLTHAHASGAFALCVNRPTKHTLRELVTDAELDLSCPLDYPLYWGGPVAPSTVWMLHSADWITEGTVQFHPDWAMTSNIEMFRALSLGECPQHFRLMMGYCSWAPGQLDLELSGQGPWRPEHTWLVAKNPGPTWVFDDNDATLWERSTTLSSHQAVASWL